MEAVIKIKSNVIDYVEVRVPSIDETPAAVRAATLDAIFRARIALNYAASVLIGDPEPAGDHSATTSDDTDGSATTTTVPIDFTSVITIPSPVEDATTSVSVPPADA